MTSESNKAICAIMTILIQVFNLAEQIGIYWAQQQLNLDDAQSRQFFFILFGIAGANMFKAFFSSERRKAVVSLIIEVGELVCYLTILGTTATIIGVSVAFFVLEVACHIVYLCLCHEDKKKKISEKVFEFARQVFIIAMINTGPILTIFLDSNSQFRQPVYEMPFVFALFFSNIILDILDSIPSWIKDAKSKISANNDESSSPLPNLEVKNLLKEKHSIQRVWMGLIYLVGSLFNIVFFNILNIVLASLELEYGGTLPSYDHGLYIYLIVGSSFTLATCPCTCCNMIQYFPMFRPD
jgi:hypothetical protein